MGVYLNPGNGSFQETLNSKIYVDKTEMLSYLNTLIRTEQKYICVSRPRRFGKTMATNMICAYYDKTADSRPLFEKYKIAKCENWDRYLNSFDVIRIVMTDFMEDVDDVKGVIDYLTEEVTAELMEANPDIKYGERINLRTVMSRIYARTKKPFVIVIDEWDAIFRTWKTDHEGQKEYLNFLRNWLKGKEYVALAYMTGILPIKKYGEHSALNMFDEYSMIAPMQMAPYTGYTESEVKELSREFHISYEQMKKWYDGYSVSGDIPIEDRKNGAEAPVYSIYSPYSVNCCLTTGIFKSYWNNTESYEALEEYIKKDYDGLKSTIMLLMDGGRVKVDLSTYQNDMTTFTRKDDVLALLIHLGYLSYIPPTREQADAGEPGEVVIPNREVLEVFKSSTESDEWTPAFRNFERSQELLKATWERDEKKVADLLEFFHDQSSNKTYNDEAALSYSIQLAYYAAQKYYTTVLELDSGKGYADIVYLPAPEYADKPAILVELKYDKSTETALDQIKKRNYPQRLEHYEGHMLLVGINYNRGVSNTNEGFKHHTCTIEMA